MHLLTVGRQMRMQSTRNVYRLTKQWPIICSYDDSCTPRYLKQIEQYWKPILNDHWKQIEKQSANAPQIDRYILAMFPYPSGSLHLGHCRLYTSSDTMARYNVIRGRTVWHPMGWDSFGLPAENAAIQKGIDPDKWTQQNISHMRSQLDSMGFNFNYMEATSQPEFYRWTQWLFLQLFKNKLAYKTYASVNWDPVDKTVLAKEQIDENGKSWRSGAVVEKKYMKQWFLKTSALIHDLYQAKNVDDNKLGWKQLISIQRSWFQSPNCYAFYLQTNKNNTVPVTAAKPELMLDVNSYMQISSDHWLTQFVDETVLNPFTNQTIKVQVNPALNNDFYGHIVSDQQCDDNKHLREQVMQQCALDKQLGGYHTNSQFHDWLVSRQRYWGTPIPTVDCDNCGVQAVDENQLPVKLPITSDYQSKNQTQTSADLPMSRLRELAPDDWLHVQCPKCKQPAQRETDTLDTFVDSSWYYLRYAAVPLADKPFDEHKASKPVWLYLGGSEHAHMHLFYARFIRHFLQSHGYLDANNQTHCEPFEQILFQGMVNGRTHNYKGQYISHEQAQQLIKSGQVSKRKIITKFEKMSKSKANGVDPITLVQKYGMDATRYCVLGATSSQKPRDWQGEQSEFYSGMRTVRKLILTVEQYIYGRQIEMENKWAPVVRRFSIRKNIDQQSIQDQLNILNDMRNQTVRDVTILYEHTIRPGTASKLLQEMLDYMRKHALTHPIGFSSEYQRCLADLLIMYCPILPHLCEEMWTGLADYLLPEVMDQYGYDRHKLCLQQQWPQIDPHYDKYVQFYFQPVKSKNAMRKQFVIDAQLLHPARQQDLHALVHQLMQDDPQLRQMHLHRITFYPHIHCDVNLSPTQPTSANDFAEDA